MAAGRSRPHRGVPGGRGLQLPQAEEPEPRPDRGGRTVAHQAARAFASCRSASRPGRPINAKHAPLHLVLLVDTSTSMRWGSRMEIVRRALRDLPGIVGGEDRLSLVTFNQAAHVLVENLSQRRLGPIRGGCRFPLRRGGDEHRRRAARGIRRGAGRRSVPGGPRCGSCC